MGCGALCAQLPRAAGWSLTRGRQTRGGGLGWDSSQHGGRVQFCAETALQPRARRPVLWFSVLFHGISRKQLPRDQRPHSPADATVTDTPHTHTQPARAPPHTRSSWSPAHLGLQAAQRSRGRRPGTEAGDGGWGWRPGTKAGDGGRGQRPGLEPRLAKWLGPENSKVPAETWAQTMEYLVAIFNSGDSPSPAPFPPPPAHPQA